MLGGKGTLFLTLELKIQLVQQAAIVYVCETGTRDGGLLPLLRINLRTQPYFTFGILIESDIHGCKKAIIIHF